MYIVLVRRTWSCRQGSRSRSWPAQISIPSAPTVNTMNTQHTTHYSHQHGQQAKQAYKGNVPFKSQKGSLLHSIRSHPYQKSNLGNSNLKENAKPLAPPPPNRPPRTRVWTLWTSVCWPYLAIGDLGAQYPQIWRQETGTSHGDILDSIFTRHFLIIKRCVGSGDPNSAPPINSSPPRFHHLPVL